MHPRAQELMALLQLAPHPEGGHYRRVHASAFNVTCRARQRAALSTIHYLLAAGEISRWHRIDADEAWQHGEGDALELLTFDPQANRLARHRLGRADARDTRPLCVVPAGCWQAARPLGDYSLVSCSVGPAFEFDGFSLLDDAPDIAAQLRALAPDLLDLR